MNGDVYNVSPRRPAKLNIAKFKFRYVIFFLVIGSFTATVIWDYVSKRACLKELRMEARPYPSEFELGIPFHITQTIRYSPGRCKIREFLILGKSRWLVCEALEISDPVIR